MIINNKEDIWAEKYRPQRIQDMILPKSFKDKLECSVEKIPNILLASETPGTGKTSLVNAIVKQTGLETLFINASMENGIDTLRGKIKSFACQQSLDGRIRLVVLDEADNLNEQSTQPALRGFIEEFSSKCRFIITCNYITKIIPAIVNRFEVYNFDEINKDQELIKQTLDRLVYILKNENIEFNNNDLINIIRTFYPSIRKMIIFLQRSSINGKLIVDQHDLMTASGFKYILEFVEKKQFNEILEATYKLSNPNSFYTWMYKNINLIPNQKKPQLITIIAKYQHMASMVRDVNLNLCACLTEIAGVL